MAVQEHQVGFECEFVEDPPKYLQTDCPVCLHIIREPYQVTCCGKSFCKVCIERVKAKNNPCPCCKQDNFDDFPNKGLQQPLYGFQVHCTNKETGCQWTGELRQLDKHLNLNQSEDDQLNGCEFADIKCSYCSLYVTRNKLLHHQNELCDKRPFQCECCNSYESTYEDVVHNHLPVCGHHPILCPNECGASFQRQNLENHIDKVCPLTVVGCEFHYAGCEVRLPRKNLQQHITDDLVAHFCLLAASHKKQQNEIKTLNEELNALKLRTTQLQSHTAIVPVDFIIENPLNYTAFKVWSSSHFYTHSKGYKLSIRFTKLSVFYIGAYILQGEFDNLLQWPFKADIIIHILNRQGEVLELKIVVENGKRVKDGDGVERCGRVSINNVIHYVRNDSLHIRVVDVQFYCDI